MDKNSKLYAIRHSLAHVLAQAVQKEFPEAKLGFGPPTEEGFYYDFDFSGKKISPEDLQNLEKIMRHIIKQNQVFEKKALNFEDAVAFVEKEQSHEVYKMENIKNLNQRGISSFHFYKNGNFQDLCDGPHVENTRELPLKAFKLDRLAGAYWLGDEKRPMLTRIYALAFEKDEELQDFLKRRQIAAEFDHKKLGKELEIYHMDDLIGKGLPLWLPNGTIIRDEIEKFAKELEFKGGYKRVSTPCLAKRELYLKSQHLPAYEESMFPPIKINRDVKSEHDEKCAEKNGKKSEDADLEDLYLRPMNCPHHHLIYKSRKRSYKELPLRLAEYGLNFRYEQSGELSGLIRVRGMCLNDAHIYCRLSQVEDEIKSILELYLKMYETFKLKSYTFRLSLRDKANTTKYKGSDEMWAQAESMLVKVLDQLQIPYFRAEGEAAFYGPKIDVQFKNLMGREETVSTIQVDFLQPVNFDLTYTDEKNEEDRVVVLHRAPLSTHERFISFLMEYYGGAFPTWLAPLQLVLIPVTEECHSYCFELADRLREQMVRVEVDTGHDSFNKKIRNQVTQKVPILAIVGKKEVEEKTLTLRRYGVKEQECLDQDAFVLSLLEEIRLRKNFREPLASM